LSDDKTHRIRDPSRMFNENILGGGHKHETGLWDCQSDLHPRELCAGRTDIEDYWRHRDVGDNCAAAWRSSDAFGAWLFTIARNAVASHWRKEKPTARALHSVAWEWELTQHHRDPEQTVLEREQMAILLYHVHQLSQREQEVLSLKFDAELSNRQISQVMNTSEVNVRVTIYRVLQKLRDRMKSMPE